MRTSSFGVFMAFLSLVLTADASFARNELALEMERLASRIGDQNLDYWARCEDSKKLLSFGDAATPTVFQILERGEAEVSLPLKAAIGARKERGIPLLLLAVHHDHPSVEVWALMPLLDLPIEHREHAAFVAFPAILRGLENSQVRVRLAAAITLRDLTLNHEISIRALISALETEADVGVRKELELALIHNLRAWDVPLDFGEIMWVLTRVRPQLQAYESVPDRPRLNPDLRKESLGISPAVIDFLNLSPRIQTFLEDELPSVSSLSEKMVIVSDLSDLPQLVNANILSWILSVGRAHPLTKNETEMLEQDLRKIIPALGIAKSFELFASVQEESLFLFILTEIPLALWSSRDLEWLLNQLPQTPTDPQSESVATRVVLIYLSEQSFSDPDLGRQVQIRIDSLIERYARASDSSTLQALSVLHAEDFQDLASEEDLENIKAVLR